MSKAERPKPLIKPDETALFYSKLRKLRWKLNHLQRAARSASDWVPALLVADREADPKKALANLRMLIAQVRAELKALLEKEGTKLSKKRWTTNRPLALASGLLSPAQATTCDPTSGIVRHPSAVTEYEWDAARTADDNWTRGSLVWTLVRRNDLWPEPPTVDVGWTNPDQAEGFAFEAGLHHQPVGDTFLDVGLAIATGGLSLLAVDPDLFENWMWHGLCLRYTFPKPDCNVRLDWETDARAVLPTGAQIDAESGFLKLQFFFAQQAPASGFPGLGSLSWLDPDPNHPPRLLVLTNDDTTHYAIGISSRVGGSMDVNQGQESCVYIGLSIQSGVTEGEACTGDCISRPEGLPDNGLFYTRVQPSFSYPPPRYPYESGVVWSMSPR